MIRTFKTHEVRMQEELTGSLWEFEPCEGDYAGTKFQMATPGCLKQIHFLQITVEKPIFVKKLLLAEISVLSVKE